MSITTPAPNSILSGAITLAASASAASGLSIASVQFKVDGNNIGAAMTTSPYTVQLDTTTLTNAAHSLTAVATDSTGASTTSTGVSITVNNAAPPIVSITQPANNASVNGTIAVAATASASSGRTITGVQFKVDGNNIGAAMTTSPYTVQLDTTTLTNAAHSLTAVATDSTGASTTSAAVSITVNNAAPPSVSITQPANNASVNGTIAVTATASASSGRTITGVQFKVDGNNIGAAVTTSPYTVQLDTATLTNAAHSLTAVATDSTGTSTTSAAVSITVSNPAPPSVSITQPANNASVNGTIAVTATASASSGRTIASVQFKVDGSNVGGPVTAVCRCSIQLTATLSNGNHLLTAVATDSGGGSGTSSAVAVTVSNAVQPPPSGTQFLTGQAFGSARNNYSGFVGMAFNVSGAPLAVNALGRMCLSGNTGSHTVKLVNSTGGDISGGAVSMSMAGCTPGQYQYATLANALNLPASGNPYYLVSQETSGGDQWYDVGAVTVGPAGSVAGPVYSTGPSSYFIVSLVGNSYVPVNLLYTGSATPPPVVTITQPANNGSVNGNVTVSASATAASGLTVASVQFKVDGINIGAAVHASPYSVQLDTTTLTNAARLYGICNRFQRSQ